MCKYTNTRWAPARPDKKMTTEINNYKKSRQTRVKKIMTKKYFLLEP